MGFWQRIMQGFAMMGQVMAYMAVLDTVGGEIGLPELHIKGVSGRDFSIVGAKLRRNA